MLLTRLVRYSRRLRDDERGVALAAVMGLMLVGMILSSLIVGSVVGGISATSATRAGVQSSASAQAGVDATMAKVIGGSCSATVTSNLSPIYSATVSYSTHTSTPGSGDWVAGCPTASAQWVKVDSTGTADSDGVAGNTSGNQSEVEAIYSRPVSTTQIITDGPAVYAYSSQNYGGSGTLVSADGTADANVLINSGAVTCSGASSAGGDLVIQAGTLTISGSCNIKGNVWVAAGTVNGTTYTGAFNQSGGVKVSGNVVAQSVSVASGTVGGSVWAVGNSTLSPSTIGGGITVTGGNLTLNGTNSVGGDIWASGNASITNGDAVTGNATATNITLNGGNVKGKVFAVNGVTGVTWYTIDGSIVAKTVQSGMAAKGGITKYPSGTPAEPAAAAPTAAPFVPPWIEFSYNQNNWTGFGYFKLPSVSQCTAAGLQTAVNSFGGGKGVIDARVCTSALTIGGSDKVNITNDLAIISPNGFSLGGSGGFEDASSANLWLIQPDLTTTDAKATCPSTSISTTISGAFDFAGNSGRIATMIYTPCKVNIGSSIHFTGQVFSGSAQVDGAALITYKPVGLPGWDLATGNAASVTSSSSTWTQVSVRSIGS